MHFVIGAIFVCLGYLAGPATAGAAGTVLLAGEYGTRTATEPARGALIGVDVRTGAIAVLSDFLDPRQGPTGALPWDVAVGRAGTVYVLDGRAGARGPYGVVFTVDPRTGRRSLVSDLSDPASGPTGVNPYSIAVGPSGAVYVVDQDAGPDINNDGAVFAIDPASGIRTLVSAFVDTTQGPALSRDPQGIAVLPDETLVVLDHAALYLIDPQDGSRVVLSRFDDADQGPGLQEPYAVAVSPKGEILVVDSDLAARTDDDDVRTSGGIVRVDPTDGTRTIVSRFSDFDGGVRVSFPTDVAVSPSGALWVPAEYGHQDGVFAVARATGRPTLLADIGAPRRAGAGPTQFFSYALGAAFHPRTLVGCASPATGRRCATRLPAIAR